MKTNLKNFKGKTVRIRVKDSVKGGKNIYKNIKGHGNDVNEVLTDLSNSGLKKLTITMNVLYSGKVNKEFKMTRGHKHNAEEVYIFLEGIGQILVDRKKYSVKKGDLITIPVNHRHRVINKGRKKLIFLTVFEKHGQSHLKKY